MTDWKGAFKKGISGFRGGEYGDAIASFTEVSLCPAPLAIVYYVMVIDTS